MMVSLKDYTSLCARDPNCKIIVSRDKYSKNKAEHRAKNRDENCVAHYQVDDDSVLKNQFKRCDFLLLNLDKKTAYLIELKGKNIEYAMEQLLATEQLFKNDLSGYDLYYRIVTQQAVKKIHSPEITRWQEEAGARQGKRVVQIKQYLIEETI